VCVLWIATKVPTTFLTSLIFRPFCFCDLNPQRAPTKDPAYDKGEAQAAGQNLVNILMSRRVESIAGDTKMMVLRNILRLSGKRFDLIVRECTVPFWDACITFVETPDENYRVCAIGSPGIGKTTSTFVLLHLLLSKGKCVVYHLCTLEKNGCIFEFRPRATSDTPSSTPYICSVHDEMRLWKIPSLRARGTFYVVDPGQTTRNCNPGDYFRARVIIVTYPNDVHWGGSSFLKPRDDNIVMLSGGTFFYYPIWSWAELLQAREYLNANSKVKLSLEEMRVRYMNVGGVPRHLWTQEKLFEPLKQTQALAVNKLSPMQAEQITMGEWEVLATDDSSQPKSSIIGYIIESNNFLVPKVTPISLMIHKLVIEKHMRNIWRTAFNHPNPGPVFEEYTWLQMIGETQQAMRSRRCVGHSNLSEYFAFRDVQLGGCMELCKVDNLVDAARERPGTLFLPNNDQQELIDFVYAEVAPPPVNFHFHAFQAIFCQTERNFELRSELRGGETATVYYLVPHTKFYRCLTKPVAQQSRTISKIAFLHVEIPRPSKLRVPVPSEVDTGLKRRTWGRTT
jgi:hypothetical protein